MESSSQILDLHRVRALESHPLWHFNLEMLIGLVSITSLLLSSYVYCITAAWLPAFSPTTTSSLQLPIQSLATPSLSNITPELSLNESIASFAFNASSRPIQFLIPGTHDTLVLSSFGVAIPSFRVRDALNRIYNDISISGHPDPSALVPKNRYKYHDDDGVTIAISASNIHRMTWLQLDEIVTGLGLFMTGINPMPGGDLQPHYHELKFSVYIQGYDYLGNGFVEYNSPQAVTVEKRETLLKNTILQLPGATLTSQQNLSSQLATEVPFHVPNTPVTLMMTPLTSVAQKVKLLTVLSNARSYVANWVRVIPDDPIPRRWFEYSYIFDRSSDITTVFIHAVVDQEITWIEVDDVIAGLIQFVSTGTGNYRPGLRFDVDVEEVGTIGMGKLWSTTGSRTVSKRATPLTPALLGNGNLALQPNGSLSTPPLNEQTNIPYPIVNSPITLIFRELGPANIPFETIGDFFDAAFKDIQPLVQSDANQSIPPHLWYFKFEAPDASRRGATLSISIYTRSAHSLTWTQLHKLLKGLQVFMVSQRRTLVFDIDLGGKGAVAEGLVWYSARSFNARMRAKRAASMEAPILRSLSERSHTPTPVLSKADNATSLSVPTYYPIPSTPIILHINPNGPQIPCIYISSCLSAALSRIATLVSTFPTVPIPGNHFDYDAPMSHLAFFYQDYNADRKLTWQQLNWTLGGLLKFTEEKESHCRAMAVEVDVMPGRWPPLGQRYGTLIMRYTGDEE